ncbi:uncharacterized protein LOC136075289 isoform X2 [Hydra vulgaris]|uniref:Uncharacterized protein LOC136075289 isoform X2 n=1 Tax=Hydra vulgaris TaxID=6087 RepID=A0ABM4B583_HYDVU
MFQGLMVFYNDKMTYKKNLRVDDILSKQTQQHVPICGQLLTEKSKAGGLITKAEMLFFTKVCGRYLMNNCIEKDRPTPTEKQDMSKSIVDCFPTLHNGTASGYIFFRDTSLIENYLLESFEADGQIVKT